MGKALAEAFPEARAVFEEVDDALGEKLSAIIWEGPGGQPDADRQRPAGADGGVSWRRSGRSRREGSSLGETVAYVAGHSLGEYSALAAAGSLASPMPRGCCASAATPCRRRCRSARAPWRRSSGSISRRRAPVAEEAAEGEVCQIANDNGAGQVVVSGNRPRSSAPSRSPGRAGAKRAMMLPVSAPFHCALMAPAAEAMAGRLPRSTPKRRWCPLVANVAAAPDQRSGGDPPPPGRAGDRDGALARIDRLVRRCRGQRASSRSAPARCCRGSRKRIAEGAETFAVGTPADVDAALAAACVPT